MYSEVLVSFTKFGCRIADKRWDAHQDAACALDYMMHDPNLQGLPGWGFSAEAWLRGAAEPLTVTLEIS